VRPMSNGINGLSPLGHLDIIESHEERIQKIESDKETMAVGLAEIKLSQKFMAESLETSTKAILEKLDSIGTKVAAFEDRIEPLELSSRNTKLRTAKVKKLTLAGLGALISAIAAAAGAWLWQRFIK
jgi:hypothetical protein